MKDQPGQHGEDQEEDQFEGNFRMTDIALTEPGEIRRELRIGLVSEDGLRDPRKRDCVPMVTAMAGTSNRVMSHPLSMPATSPEARPTAMSTGVSAPALAAAPMASEESATMEPTDTSMSPQRMMNIMGSATTAFSMKLNVVSRRLTVSKKYGEMKEPPVITAKKMT